MGKVLHKKIKILLIVLAVVAAMVGMAAYAVHSLNKPAMGTIKQAEPTDLQANQVTTKKLSSGYLSASYPNRYGINELSAATSASLHAWMLVAHQASIYEQAAQISIIITNLPVGGVKQDSAYSLYSSRPEIYKLSKATYNNDPVYVSKRSDQTYQKSILWPHKNFLLTITLTTSNETDAINHELDTILKSVKWSS
jgi:hypothetical protein